MRKVVKGMSGSGGPHIVTEERNAGGDAAGHQGGTLQKVEQSRSHGVNF